jgi:hypothetical protein
MLGCFIVSILGHLENLIHDILKTDPIDVKHLYLLIINLLPKQDNALNHRFDARRVDTFARYDNADRSDVRSLRYFVASILGSLSSLMLACILSLAVMLLARILANLYNPWTLG